MHSVQNVPNFTIDINVKSETLQNKNRKFSILSDVKCQTVLNVMIDIKHTYTSHNKRHVRGLVSLRF